MEIILTDDPLKPRLREYLILHGVEFGTDKLFLCPFHDDHKATMGIHPAGTNAHCFSCDATADIYTFGAHYYGLDEKRDFPEIKKRIEAELGMSTYTPQAETKPKKTTPPPVTLSLEASRMVYTHSAIMHLGAFIFEKDLAEDAALEIEKVYPCRNEGGDVEFIEARFLAARFKDGRKRTAAMWWTGEKLLARNAPHGLFGRELLRPSPDKPILIVEGPKCQAVAKEKLPGFIPIAWNGGANGQRSIDFAPLAGRRVYIYPDDDAPGRASAEKTKRILEPLGCVVTVVEPVAAARKLKAKGADIVEALEVMEAELGGEKGREELAEYIRNYTPPEPPAVPEAAPEGTVIGDDGRIIIAVDQMPETEAMHRAEKSLRISPMVFAMGNAIMWMKKGNRGKYIEPVKTYPAMQKLLSDNCLFEDGGEEKFCPKNIAQIVMVCETRGIKELDKIINRPIITVSGDIVAESGYNAETHCYIENSIALKTVEDPVAVLDDLFIDFPFASPTDKTAAFAALLTTLARQMLPGEKVPGFIIKAPSKGTGKTLLAQTIMSVANGIEASSIEYTRDGEELSKRITANFAAGEEFIFIDNVDIKLKSAKLAELLTSTIYKGRILGTSTNIICPATSNIFITANNPDIDGDLTRRLVSITIDSNEENPFKTSRKFRHKDPVRYAIKNRDTIIAACFAMLKSAVGKTEDYTGEALGSYEYWSALIGTALQNYGIDTFLKNQDDFIDDTDSEKEMMGQFVDLWIQSGKREMPTNELMGFAKTAGIIRESDPTKALTRILKRYKGRIVNGVKISRTDRLQHNSLCWTWDMANKPIPVTEGAVPANVTGAAGYSGKCPRCGRPVPVAWPAQAVTIHAECGYWLEEDKPVYTDPEQEQLWKNGDVF
jgi:putative DNA primase/helicase